MYEVNSASDLEEFLKKHPSTGQPGDPGGSGYQAPAPRAQWAASDYHQAHIDLAMRGMGYPLPEASLHPLTVQLQGDKQSYSMLDIARHKAALDGHKNTRAWDVPKIVASGYGSSIANVMTGAADRLALRQNNSDVGVILRNLFQPRELKNYNGAKSVSIEIEPLRAPSTAGFLPYETVLGRYTGSTLQLGRTDVTCYFGPQFVANDDFGAIEATTSAVNMSLIQNELEAVMTLLESNPTLDDGAVMFNSDNIVSVASSEKNYTTLSAALAKLRNFELNGKPCNADVRYILVPATDEGVVRDKAHQFFDGNSLTILLDPKTAEMKGWTRVFGVADDYLPSGSWYMFGSPAIYPTILRGTLAGVNGQSIGWGVGGQRSGDLFGSIRLDAAHSVGFQAVSRAGVVRIDFT